ncbi:hypothetical protein A3Q56_08347 [Intoshia linei]|uniref:Uncharacterized protein n=1 Tax=Intoshia linei TaxID=1819745 RepID=A0A177API1_9BILA|nr:hypothetical protein A3Q56_08347 [Intoshia linei]
MQRKSNCIMGYVDCRNLNEKNIYNLPEVYYDASYEIEDISKYNSAEESNFTSDSMENNSNLLYPHNMSQSQSDVVKISGSLAYSIYCTVYIVNGVMKIMGYRIFPKSIEKQACSLKICQTEINKLIVDYKGDFCIHFDSKTYKHQNYLSICLSG